MRCFLVLLLGVFVINSGVSMADRSTCSVLFEVRDGDTVNPWRTVNDGVMGGRSSGGSFVQDGQLSFKGATNTRGGGFSSIRLPLAAGAMAHTDYLKVSMKRDARRYSMTLRTNVTSWGRPVAFRADLHDGPKGEWGDGILRFEELKASIWGRAVRGASFDPAEVREISFIIYDGEDGPFHLDVKRIEACQSAMSPVS